MKFTPLRISGVMRIEPTLFKDERGFFFESFNKRKFAEHTGHSGFFVQDNQSLSHHGVLRGLHYQSDPHAQGKLVRAIRGEVFDVCVDLRKSSPTFGQWVAEILSAENKRQLWIPAGFAHGFLTLSQEAELAYKTTDFWSRQHEHCLRWNDPEVGIAWPLEQLQCAPLVNAKDAKGLPLKESRTFS